MNLEEFLGILGNFNGGLTINNWNFMVMLMVMLMAS